MVTETQSENKVQASVLLQKVCDILFANLNRYLRMKSLFPKDHFAKDESIRFEPPKSEGEEIFKIHDNCPKDLANYINSKGGSQVFQAKQKISNFKNKMKT